MNVEKNRRGYFRIDDDVFLHVEKIDRAGIVDIDAYFKKFRQSTMLTAKFERQRTSMAPVLKHIDVRDSATASYLSMLSDQIDLLANKLMTTSIFASDEPLQPVNISADSMRFNTRTEHQVGDFIELVYVMFPDGDYIPVIAEVVRSERDDDVDEYVVAVKYVCMNEDDKELVIHHNLYLQRLLLQKKRLSG